jgi:hypothetical protein
MDRAAAATAIVLTAIVAVRFMQPALIHPPAAAEAPATQLAAAPASEGRARAGGAKSAAARAAADAARAQRAHKAAIGGQRQEATRLVKTKLGGTNPRLEIARAQQRAIAQSHSATSIASRLAATPMPQKAGSPEQLCADRTNFISRGFCEHQVCLQAAWREHAYCVGKREQEMRSNPLLASSS